MTATTTGLLRVRAAMLVLLLATAAPVHADGAATKVVETLHAALADNMAGGQALGFRGRLARIEPVVAAVFDFSTITRVALGDAYAKLDATTQARFRALIERHSALTYAGRFDSADDGARFVTVSEQAARGGRFLVRTRLERDGAPPVTLDYLLEPGEAGPRIVNVLADGVSDLSLKRAEYAAVIRSDGVDTLLKRIEAQVSDLARAGSG